MEHVVTIRDAEPGDLPAITEIHNALLATTTYEWTATLHTVEDSAEWLASQRRADDPTLVAVDAGEVVGWAAYGDFRDSSRWPGYRHTVEHSVHVRQDRWRQGVGRGLMDALMARARAAGKHVMVAAVDAANTDSLEFHARLGFVEVARMPEVGEKFGRRLDLVLMQRFVEPSG
jgi:phosphinothricin acetyltransferase